MKKAAAAALVLALVLPAAVRGQDTPALATLENGTSVGFALLRTGTHSPGGGIGEVVLPRSNSVSRVLWDRDSGAYFGYRVEVERRDGVRGFRVAFKPLDRGAVERELKQHGSCPACPTPAPLGAGPQFPPVQQIGEGEALTLELLANPTTGERILDVVKLSARPISGESMHAAVARALEGQQAIRRATLLVARTQYNSALDEYKKALAVQPNDATIYNAMAICYQSLGNENLARQHYDRALALRPGYAEVWNNIGTLEQSRRRFKEAVRAYRRSIRVKSLAKTWKNLGTAYLALGQVQEAVEAFQEAFRVDPTILAGGQGGPESPSAGVDAATQNFYLAKMFATNGQNDAALDMLRRAVDAGFRDFDRVQSDPAFKLVVKDARYKELASHR